MRLLKEKIHLEGERLLDRSKLEKTTSAGTEVKSYFLTDVEI